MLTGGSGLYEHRVVMEDLLGRPLHRDEQVHHKNGDRSDNRPENLELWYKKQPGGQRVADIALDALLRLSPADRERVVAAASFRVVAA